MHVLRMVRTRRYIVHLAALQYVRQNIPSIFCLFPCIYIFILVALDN